MKSAKIHYFLIPSFIFVFSSILFCKFYLEQQKRQFKWESWLDRYNEIHQNYICERKFAEPKTKLQVDFWNQPTEKVLSKLMKNNNRNYRLISNKDNFTLPSTYLDQQDIFLIYAVHEFSENETVFVGFGVRSCYDKASFSVNLTATNLYTFNIKQLLPPSTAEQIEYNTCHMKAYYLEFNTEINDLA